MTEDQRRKVVAAIGRETLTASELFELVAEGQGRHEADRWVASAVSHGYVRMRRSGNVRLYTVRPAGECYLIPPPLRPSTVPPAIKVTMSIPHGMSMAQARAVMADVIDDALSARGWSA